MTDELKYSGEAEEEERVSKTVEELQAAVKELESTVEKNVDSQTATKKQPRGVQLVRNIKALAVS